MPKLKPAVRKNRKQINKIQSYWVTGMLLAIGGFMLAYQGIQRQIQAQVLAVEASTVMVRSDQVTVSQGRPQRLLIEGKVDVGLEPGEIRNGRWTVSGSQGTYLVNSARLGERGNVILYGHNKTGMLSRLDETEPGDAVMVADEMGGEWRYRITQKERVNQSEVEWLQPTNEAVLTIYTCAGFMDTQRLIVRAEGQGSDEKGVHPLGDNPR